MTKIPSWCAACVNSPKKVAAIEKPGAMVERELARIIRDDSAGVDDDRLHFGAFPEASPPLDVITNGVFLGDVGLPPSIGSPVPGKSLSRLLRGRVERQPRGDGSALHKKATAGLDKTSVTPRRAALELLCDSSYMPAPSWSKFYTSYGIALLRFCGWRR
jgi:hypothetical protein